MADGKDSFTSRLVGTGGTSIAHKFSLPEAAFSAATIHRWPTVVE
jgi:hypothetical protein